MGPGGWLNRLTVASPKHSLSHWRYSDKYLKRANWRREQLSNVIYSSKIVTVISPGCFGDKPKLLI